MTLYSLYVRAVNLTHKTVFKFYAPNTIFHRDNYDVVKSQYEGWENVPDELKHIEVDKFAIDRYDDVLHVELCVK